MSSNGTFMFMKCHQQIEDRVPSELIPLHEGMLLSFVNYELRVKLEPRTQQEVNALAHKAEEFFKARKPGTLGYQGEVEAEEYKHDMQQVQHTKGPSQNHT